MNGASQDPGTLLEVENLSVTFPSQHGDTHAVREVSFSLGRERLGIVGESGSGKSTTGRALLGLLAPPAEVRADRLAFRGQDLRNLTSRMCSGSRRLRVTVTSTGHAGSCATRVARWR